VSNLRRFLVTYEILPQESAKQGSVAGSGVVESGLALREALEVVRGTRTSHCDGVVAVESDDSRLHIARWFTVYNGMEYMTGAQESRSLHVPESVTGASRIRIARLMGVKGA